MHANMETVSVLGTDPISLCAVDSHSKVAFFPICGAVLVCTSPLLWGRCTWLFCVCIPKAWCSSFFPSGSDGKDSACTTGGPVSIPGWGRSPGGGHGNPLQCPCLENPTDRGAWWGYPPWGRKESDTIDGVRVTLSTLHVRRTAVVPAMRSLILSAHLWNDLGNRELISRRTAGRGKTLFVYLNKAWPWAATEKPLGSSLLPSIFSVA